MWFLLSMVLPVATSLLLAGAASALWWGTLRSPWAYLTFSVLTMLGVQRVLQMVLEVTKIALPGGYFLEHRPAPDVLQAARESITTESLVMCVLLLAIGAQLLHWLRTLFPRA